MRKLLLALSLPLLLASSSLAQSVRYQSQALSSRGAGIANATIAVCTQPAVTTTQPCSPLATLATSTSTTSGGANPLTADSFGNFFFYAAPGRYTVQIYGPAVFGQLVIPDVDITSVQTISNVQMCDQFAGATADLKIAACIAALPSNGGTADARGLQGNQSFASTLIISKTVTLLLGAAKITGPASGALIDVQAPGIVIRGSGSMQNTGASQGTVLVAVTSAQADGIHLSATGSGNVQYKVQDLTINDSTAGGTTRTAGRGISADANASPAQNSIGEIDNVYVSFMFTGIYINRPITTNIYHATSVQSKQDDFDFQGDGTSTWCIGCYGNFSGRHNFAWFGINYGGCIGCASDHAVKDGYHIARQADSSGAQSIAVSITNTGAEADCTSGGAGCAGIHDVDSVGLYVTGCKVLNSTGYGIWIDGTRAANLSGIISGSTSVDLQVQQSSVNGQNVFPAGIIAQNLQYPTQGGGALSAATSTMGWTAQAGGGNAWFQFAYPIWFTEEAAPTAQPNVDLCYGDSTAHALKCSYNNGPFNVIAQQATLTLKTGSGGGNYTGTNTALAAVDTTNLCAVITVPTGWKLLISASGVGQQNTAAAGVSIALADAGATCASGGITALNGSQRDFVPPAITTNDQPFHTQALITGDGNPHSIALMVKTANAADAWVLVNSSAVSSPSISYTLMPSN